MNYFFHLIQPTVPVPLQHIENSKNNQIDSRLVWDVLKIEIRDHTIMYCKNKSKLNRQERRSLEKELNVRLAKRDSK
jgi:predicted secreted Zn-dependent protease